MKNKEREIPITYKGIIVAMIISTIILMAAILLMPDGFDPVLHKNKGLHVTFSFIIFLLGFFSFISICITIGMLIFQCLTEAEIKRSIRKSSEIVNNTLTTEYLPVRLCNIIALHHIINDAVDNDQVVCEAKISKDSNEKVAIKLKLDIETEIFVDQFTDNFEVKN